ncbi:MAG: hypothetical protein ACPGR7_06200 [Flavobacteriaceae bacterium]
MMTMIHSIMAYLVVITLGLAVINAFIKWQKGNAFKKSDRTLSLIALIFSHIQLLIGLAVWAHNGYFKVMGEAMKEPALRKLAVEHPVTMILAIVFITIGWSKHKKQTEDSGKFKSIALFYGIGLILILAMIPWNQWI